MASTGKKVKNKKPKQTMSLQHFLAKDNEDVQAGYSVVTAKRPAFDWAAEAEKEGPDDDDILDTVYTGKDRYILPSAPLGPNIDMSKVPDSPPYTAFVGGLPYDVEQDDISNFFKKLKIKSIRIPHNTGDNQRFRGFGYVEFEDRESLIDALGMNESNFKAGRVKIDVAENQDDPNRRRDKGGDRGDRGQRNEHMERDWRSGPREEPVRSERSGGFRDDPPRERDRDRYSDKYSSDRDRDRYESRGFDRGSSNDRDKDYGGPRDRDRGGFGNYRASSDRSYGGDRERRGYDRGGRGGGGGGRRDFGSGFRDDDRSDYGGRGSWSNNYNRPSRSGRPNDGGENEGDMDREPPKERKKLVIQPRTKPLDEANAPVANSAIFGGAKPVDTAAREREIEERLAREHELTAARAATDNRVREPERDVHKEESYDDKSDLDPSERQRRSSTGSHIRSPRTSTSAPPVRSGDGGTSGQSETDEEKPEKSPVITGKPPSPRREDCKAVPAPPPKENAWSKRASNAQQQQSLSSGDRSLSSGSEHDGRQSSEFVSSKRSSSVSSTGSDNDRSHRPVNAEQNDPNTRKDDSYVRRDDGGYIGRNDARDRSDRGAPRGVSRGGPRGTGRGYGDRRGGSDYSRNNTSQSANYNRYDRSRDNDRPREMLKFVEPDPPVYTSSNKYTQLEDEELA